MALMNGYIEIMRACRLDVLYAQPTVTFTFTFPLKEIVCSLWKDEGPYIRQTKP